MSNAMRLLSALSGVKQTGRGRWIAQCPAHSDRSPSLSVRETEDGRVLVHDFGGCDTGAVLDALGLTMGCLFEHPVGQCLPPVRAGFTARELLELNAHEAGVVALLAEKAASHGLSSDESSRLMQAAGRLGRAESLLHGR